MRGPLAVLILCAIVDGKSALAQQPIDQPPHQRPEAVEPIQPEYSDEANIAGLEGDVKVLATLASDGSLRDFEVEQSLGLGLDEQAIEALKRARFEAGGISERLPFPVRFTLPSKQSRWHLVRVKFIPPQGASRPTFANAEYPIGPGISRAAYDEGRLIGAISRSASATIAFDVDEHGDPRNFDIVNASADVWGPEAIALVSAWRFHHGDRDGKAVAVPCEVSLSWGPIDFAAPGNTVQIAAIFSPPRLSQPPRENQAGIAKPAAPRTTPTLTPVNQTQPEYPEEARKAGLEGEVWIELQVDADGVPQMVSVRSGLALGLSEAAAKAVRSWRFPSTLLNGRRDALVRDALVLVEFRAAGVTSGIFWLAR